MEHLEQLDEKTPYRVQARDVDEFIEMTSRKDVAITRALVESIMGSEDPSNPDAITIEFATGSYTVIEFETNQTEGLMNLLREAVPDFEREEWYELCDRVKRFLTGWQISLAEREKSPGTGESGANRAKK